MASRSIICPSRKRRQLIGLQDTDKSRYFAMTEFNNCFIIRSSSLFFKGILSGSEAICHFHARVIARRRKAWFHFRMSRILFADKQSWATLRMSRPLFVGSCLQITWWALGQWKGEKFAKNNNAHYLPCLSVHEHIFPLLSSEHMTVISNCTSGLLAQLISKTTKQIKNQFQDTDTCNLRIW